MGKAGRDKRQGIRGRGEASRENPREENPGIAAAKGKRRGEAEGHHRGHRKETHLPKELEEERRRGNREGGFVYWERQTVLKSTRTEEQMSRASVFLKRKLSPSPHPSLNSVPFFVLVVNTLL